MSGFHWLLLKDGQLAIGTKDDPMGRTSWAALMRDGSMRAVSDDELLDKKVVREPVYATEETTTLVGEIQ